MNKNHIAVAVAALLAMQSAPALAFDWNGFYAGVGVGYSSVDSDISYDLIPMAPDFSMAPDGWFGSVAVGFNAALGSGLVVGVEADLSLADLTDTVPDVLVPGETVTATTDWMGSLRGRIGFDAGDFMPYVTGGVVAAHVETSATDGAGVQDDDVLVGGIAGVGVEFAVADNITVKSEYLYSAFGEHTWYEGEAYQNTSTSSSHAIRGGVNFHF